MQIRKMLTSDYARILALWKNTPGMGLNAIDDSESGIEKYLRRNPDTCFVAEAGGEIIGALLSGHDGRRGFINHPAVKASERNRGVATALVDRAMGALRAEGITKVALVVFADNALGNAFWERRGFTARGDLVYRNKNIIGLPKMEEESDGD